MSTKMKQFMAKKEKQDEKEEKQAIFDAIKAFQIEHLFGSKTRARLLSLFLDDVSRAYYVRELTRRIDAQLNSVRRELQNLVDLGIVSEVEGTILIGEKHEEINSKKDKKKYYQANIDCPFFEELRSMMKKAAILSNKMLVEVLQEHGDVDLVLLTGRFLDQENVPSDILIVGTLDQEAVKAAIESFEHEIGREVNYTYMPRDEYRYRLEVKDRFVASLFEAEHVTLVDELESVL